MTLAPQTEEERRKLLSINEQILPATEGRRDERSLKRVKVVGQIDAILAWVYDNPEALTSLPARDIIGIRDAREAVWLAAFDLTGEGQWFLTTCGLMLCEDRRVTPNANPRTLEEATTLLDALKKVRYPSN